MDLNWVPPQNETQKINVHATSFAAPMPNGNTNGIGVILRTSNGNMTNCIAGTIPHLTPLAAPLWGIQVGFVEALLTELQTSFWKQTIYKLMVRSSMLTFISAQNLMIIN